jgi:hypothetical protein
MNRRNRVSGSRLGGRGNVDDAAAGVDGGLSIFIVVTKISGWYGSAHVEMRGAPYPPLSGRIVRRPVGPAERAQAAVKAESGSCRSRCWARWRSGPTPGRR